MLKTKNYKKLIVSVVIGIFAWFVYSIPYLFDIDVYANSFLEFVYLLIAGLLGFPHILLETIFGFSHSSVGYDYSIILVYMSLIVYLIFAIIVGIYKPSKRIIKHILKPAKYGLCVGIVFVFLFSFVLILSKSNPISIFLMAIMRYTLALPYYLGGIILAKAGFYSAGYIHWAMIWSLPIYGILGIIFYNGYYFIKKKFVK